MKALERHKIKHVLLKGSTLCASDQFCNTMDLSPYLLPLRRELQSPGWRSTHQNHIGRAGKSRQLISQLSHNHLNLSWKEVVRRREVVRTSVV